MKKSYTQQLGEWVRRRECAQRDKSLAVFLAVCDAVQASLVAGYAVKTVRHNMQESKRINFSYTAFLRHVNCIHGRIQAQQRSLSPRPVTPPSPNRNGQQSATCEKPVTKSIMQKVSAGVTFNPAPNIDELI